MEVSETISQRVADLLTTLATLVQWHLLEQLGQRVAHGLDRVRIVGIERSADQQNHPCTFTRSPSRPSALLRPVPVAHSSLPDVMALENNHGHLPVYGSTGRGQGVTLFSLLTSIPALFSDCRR